MKESRSNNEVRNNFSQPWLKRIISELTVTLFLFTDVPQHTCLLETQILPSPVPLVVCCFIKCCSLHVYSPFLLSQAIRGAFLHPFQLSSVPIKCMSVVFSLSPSWKFYSLLKLSPAADFNSAFGKVSHLVQIGFKTGTGYPLKTNECMLSRRLDLVFKWPTKLYSPLSEPPFHAGYGDSNGLVQKSLVNFSKISSFETISLIYICEKVLSLRVRRDRCRATFFRIFEGALDPFSRSIRYFGPSLVFRHRPLSVPQVPVAKDSSVSLR